MATKHVNELAPHVRGVDPEYGKREEGSDETAGYVGVSPEYQNAANKTDVPKNVSGDKVETLVDKGVNNQFELVTDQAVAKENEDDESDGGNGQTQPPKPPVK